MNREKIPAFELMLWRFCRGNAFLKTADLDELIEDPQNVSRKYFLLLKKNGGAFSTEN
jgi:hypothetical protein